ncbi:hypothetical protein PFICI_02467 [Pestalotiopsis fici W106-1]|uniref:Tyrosinase copper-binding domain-containing protein n=1 Tax=Pestalotiopsis fici (strain W106-1 / CGMCC3.15140) TaxID=1229662 RepID=W3XG90_PESFW|nr:uncharacterized protein PFICI_02467 [Pestalotiopsis fici W106-1]ETS84442.1 hypothetical protein PFICI_02467 [Pestalotiopsis fici W106-1]
MLSGMSIIALLALATFSQVAPVLATYPAECTEENIQVRREWSSLALEDRKAYIDAVQCLMDKPSQLDPTVYPGAKSRHADFIATHINYTFTIHLDAIFLPWHRGYVRLYEKALQEECGFNGTQPYWDWPAYTDKPLRESTLFDGSPYSLGSDGVFTNETLYTGPNQTYPSGTGGGCVFAGPFMNYTTPYRDFPQSLITDNVNGSLPSDSFDYSPGCFKRNLNDYALRVNNNYSSIAELLNQTTMGDFQNTLSSPEGASWFGPHGGGHFAMGGVGSDLFTSPTDPAFFLHHAQVDHVWWQWQSADLEARAFALNGTMTLSNVPPSRDLTLGDYLTWGPLSDDKQVKDLMLPYEGPFCYRYE